MSVDNVAKAILILSPIIQDCVNSIDEGKLWDFIDKLPDQLRSRVALEARKREKQL